MATSRGCFWPLRRAISSAVAHDASDVRETVVSGFDKRERAEEGKFALDQELRFKANARRNKLLGLWAAEKLGKSGEAASTYAVEVVKSDFEAPGDEDVF